MAPQTLSKVVQVNRPSAGERHILITSAGINQVHLNFFAGEAALEKAGDDLFFGFEDGASVVLRGFYAHVTRATVPAFVVGNTAVTGEAFFAAGHASLMPAGPVSFPSSPHSALPIQSIQSGQSGQSGATAGCLSAGDSQTLSGGLYVLAGLEPGTVTPTVLVAAWPPTLDHDPALPSGLCRAGDRADKPADSAEGDILLDDTDIDVWALLLDAAHTLNSENDREPGRKQGAHGCFFDEMVSEGLEEDMDFDEASSLMTVMGQDGSVQTIRFDGNEGLGAA